MSVSETSSSSNESFLDIPCKKNVFNTVLINARSLLPKLTSLKKLLSELCADICLITETWLSDLPKINNEVEDFNQKTLYELLRRDRRDGRGGGVGICYNKNKLTMSKAKIPPCKHEIFAAIGRRAGQRRKVAVVVCYVPPWYNAEQNRSFYKAMNDTILALTNKYNDPHFVIGGDFNRRSHFEATRDFSNIRPVPTGPTRGDATLDIVLTNFNDSILDNCTVDSVSNAEGVAADHLAVFTSHRMPRVPSYEVEQYSYFHTNQEGDRKFHDWLAVQDWAGVFSAVSPSDKVECLHELFREGMSASYEWKTRKKKTSEPVWMTDWLREMIKDRRTVFINVGFRSTEWRSMKKRTKLIVKERKKNYYDHVLAKFESCDSRDYFRNVKCLLGESPKARWSPRDLYPNLPDAEVAERLAAYFNSISSQYQPLNTTNLPPAKAGPVFSISHEEVVQRLKKAKKKPTNLPGDLHCKLYDLYPEQLAVPITHIFQAILKADEWPELWRREYVTVIPKCKAPQEESDCRNISCTNFLSKIFESFVLEWSRAEVVPKLNQYRGEPAAGAAHLLIETVDYIASSLEDNRAGVVLSTVDFSKAFNRLDHEHFLRSLIARGASDSIIELLSCFLSSRSMSVRVGQEHSSPRPINAGAPQGSVLGCFLFNMGVDDLEENFCGPEAVELNADQETLVQDHDYPTVSTPRRVGRGPSNVPSSPIGAPSQTFDLLPGVANIPPWILKAKDPLFKTKPIDTRKFVDDGINMNKINLRSARMLVEGGRYFKSVNDERTQALLNHIAGNAQAKGMVINQAKTTHVCDCCY